MCGSGRYFTAFLGSVWPPSQQRECGSLSTYSLYGVSLSFQHLILILGCRSFWGLCGHMLGLSGSPEESAVVFLSSSSPSILMHGYMLNCFGTRPWSRAPCAGSWRLPRRDSLRSGLQSTGWKPKDAQKQLSAFQLLLLLLPVLTSLISPLVTNNLLILLSSFAQFILHTAARATFVKCKNVITQLQSFQRLPDRHYK